MTRETQDNLVDALTWMIQWIDSLYALRDRHVTEILNTCDPSGTGSTLSIARRAVNDAQDEM